MNRDDLVAVFDQQASGYDARWDAVSPLRDGLYLLIEAALRGLPHDASILCVGVGTGTELSWLARTFPGWRFTAVEPSGPMLDVCRQRAEREAIAARCSFHEGYLESLPSTDLYHAATCLLVSQFLLDPDDRTAFFRSIAQRLRPGGILLSADLATGPERDDYDRLLPIWLAVTTGQVVSDERLAKARAGYAADVDILPPSTVATIIEKGGFEPPAQLYQAGLLHAWMSTRR